MTPSVTKVLWYIYKKVVKLRFEVNEGKILSSKSVGKKLGFTFLLDPQLNDQLTDGMGLLVKNFFDGFKVSFYIRVKSISFYMKIEIKIEQVSRPPMSSSD